MFCALLLQQLLTFAIVNQPKFGLNSVCFSCSFYTGLPPPVSLSH